MEQITNEHLINSFVRKLSMFVSNFYPEPERFKNSALAYIKTYLHYHGLTLDYKAPKGEFLSVNGVELIYALLALIAESYEITDIKVFTNYMGDIYRELFNNRVQFFSGKRTGSSAEKIYAKYALYVPDDNSVPDINLAYKRYDKQIKQSLVNIGRYLNDIKQ